MQRHEDLSQLPEFSFNLTFDPIAQESDHVVHFTIRQIAGRYEVEPQIRKLYHHARLLPACEADKILSVIVSEKLKR